MASRRTRIKGIANIPQRRKNNLPNEEYIEPQENPDENFANENNNLTFDTDKKSNNETSHVQPRLCTVSKLDDKSNDSISQTRSNSVVGNEDLPQDVLISNNKITHHDAVVINNDTVIKLENQNNQSFDVSENKINNVNLTEQSKRESKPTLIRRKFIKPTVSFNIINKKNKQNVDKESKEKSDTSVTEKTDHPPKENYKEEILNFQKVQNLVQNREVNDNLKLKQSTSINISNLNTENEVTLNETHLTPQAGVILKPEGPLDKGVKKITHLNQAHNSDSEYPPPPPSPSKINRSRIKAIPRLSYRKTSFSASESEDESRKNSNRNRNDSVCSTASGVTETVVECMSPQRPKEYNSILQKKCNRTEQSRRLAEARREFQRRFGTNKPDRQRLTMIDLIFYNPTTNPMKEEMKNKQDNEECIQENTDVQRDEDEKVDDPEEGNEGGGKSDEENEMPVPQIKISASGEIILDEKSLVVESKQVKKQREELQKTELVDGDFNTSYGVYKRQKRSKGWTQNETLRFYKALNTIGTDFALMCELFPKRTRRELKMKFKKEERINKTLINKAIMEPCSFNLAELKHEVDMEERELEELQKQREGEIQLKKQKNEERLARKRKASKKDDIEETEQSKEPSEAKPKKIRKIRKPKVTKLTIESVLENSDADESDIATQSESEDEISMPLRPTRSGRVPKVTKRFDNTQDMNSDCVVKANKVADDIKSRNIEPGSIMIMTEKGPNGEPVYKIYMVTPDHNATPLNLTSEIVSKAIEFKKGLTAQNIVTISANVTDDEQDKDPVPEENNVTIPADETVTTLKGDKNLSKEMDMSKEDNNSLTENGVKISNNECDIDQNSLPEEHG